MNNVYVPTKGGELIRLAPALANAGFRRVPSTIISPPFDKEEIRVKTTVLKAYTRKDGPFLPYLMLRNNGAPTGTGRGMSVPVHLDEKDTVISRRLHEIMESDKEAAGVLMQPFVGQMLFQENDGLKIIAPLLSGIAYTQKATERGNAIMEWCYGHPKKAVKGAGKYIAFNPENMISEAEAQNIVEATRGIYSLGDPRQGYSGQNLGLIFQEAEKWDRPYEDYDLMEKVMESIWKLGKTGAYYIEWAMTQADGAARLFALQVAEVDEKLAGVPTKAYEALKRFDFKLECTGVEAQDLEMLKKLYEQALLDPEVIAVSFDIVGKGKREFGNMVWTPDERQLRKMPDAPLVLAYGEGVEPLKAHLIARDRKQLTGLVELNKREVHINTFRGHMHGDANFAKIFGMGSTVNMADKLDAFLPMEWRGGVNLSNTLIRGKFMLEVDETLPFGTLRIERIDSVERL